LYQLTREGGKMAKKGEGWSDDSNNRNFGEGGGSNRGDVKVGLWTRKTSGRRHRKKENREGRGHKRMGKKTGRKRGNRNNRERILLDESGQLPIICGKPHGKEGAALTAESAVKALEI